MAECGERPVVGDAERFAELAHRGPTQCRGEVRSFVVPDVADDAGNDLEAAVEHEAAETDDELTGARESNGQQPEGVHRGARHQQQGGQECHDGDDNRHDRQRTTDGTGERADTDERRRQAGRADRRRSEHTETELAFGERLGCEHSGVDRLGEAGDDADHHHPERDADRSEHEQCGGVVGGASGAEQDRGSDGSDEHRADQSDGDRPLLCAVTAECAPQHLPPQSGEQSHHGGIRDSACGAVTG